MPMNYKVLARFNPVDYLMITYLITWLDNHWDGHTSTIPMVMRILYMNMFEFVCVKGWGKMPVARINPQLQKGPERQLFLAVKDQDCCSTINEEEWSGADRDKRNAMLARAIETLHTEWLSEHKPVRADRDDQSMAIGFDVVGFDVDKSAVNYTAMSTKIPYLPPTS